MVKILPSKKAKIKICLENSVDNFVKMILNVKCEI